MSFDRVLVVGAGAWGTALANTLVRAGRRVRLWARDRSLVEAMQTTRANPHLPGVVLEGAVAPLAELEPEQADAVVLAIPAQALREVCGLLAPKVRNGTPLVACAKGIERGTHRFMTDVITAGIPAATPAILSGPSFAADVAAGLPTAVTLAAADENTARDLAAAFATASFRPYHSTDVRGVEIGGAAKNVLAIAAGIVAGRRLGASASAALTTRGFAELLRFGLAYGARPETLTGLSGLGDLLLSCSTAQSRNYAFGIALGEGRVVTQDPGSEPLVEGVFTAPVLVAMARERGVDMPIATAVAQVLDGGLTIDEAIDSLLTRPLRAEI